MFLTASVLSILRLFNLKTGGQANLFAKLQNPNKNLAYPVLA